MTSWRKEGRGVRRTAPQFGIQTAGRQGGLDQVRLVSRTAPRDTHYDCAGDGMGAAGQDCAPRGMGQAAQFRTRLCSPLERS